MNRRLFKPFDGKQIKREIEEELRFHLELLLLSKFLATLLLTLALILLVGLVTLTLQAIKRNGPIEVLAYLRIYSLILIPNAIFLAAAAVALNVLLRDRYLTYAVAIGTSSGLFYLYIQGHNHWLYNPLLFRLWTYSDLIGGANQDGEFGSGLTCTTGVRVPTSVGLLSVEKSPTKVGTLNTAELCRVRSR